MQARARCASPPRRTPLDAASGGGRSRPCRRCWRHDRRRRCACGRVRNQGAHIASVTEPEHAHLGPLSNSSMTTAVPHRRNAARRALVQARSASSMLLQTTTPLPARARRPDHAGSAELGNERAEAGAIRGFAGTPARRWDTRRVHHCFAKSWTTRCALRRPSARRRARRVRCTRRHAAAAAASVR